MGYPLHSAAVQGDRPLGTAPGGGAEGRGIAWMVQRPGAEAEFVVATRFGPRQVRSFEELLAALDVVGSLAIFH